jgi:hypothetical protein
MSRPGYVDKRGNVKDRARRRAWLLLTFDVDLGPGRARCHLKLSAYCEIEVDSDTLSVDRKVRGGTYARHNIQPACKPCQDRQGGLAAVESMEQLIVEYRYARELWEVRFDVETGHTYRPGIIARERRRERRGGRREITDWLDENPPPVFTEWLSEWHASRREPAQELAEGSARASAV